MRQVAGNRRWRNTATRALRVRYEIWYKYKLADVV